MYGFYRVSVAVPELFLTNTAKNAENITNLISEATDSSIILFPELCLTGYTSGDLFFNQNLYNNQIDALQSILKSTENNTTIIVIGMAILDANRLYNCAVVLQKGKILGIVPKTYLPNKKEFYEKRHFTSGKNCTEHTIELCGEIVPFGVDLLFRDEYDLCFGIEICEDLWVVAPPSSQLAINGATLILNLSASNELIGKSSYRQNLVESQSARAMCAYAYASSGVGESTSDTVFGGDGMIAEYGNLLARTGRFSMQNQLISAEVDLQKLAWLRLTESSFGDETRTPSRNIKCAIPPLPEKLTRTIDTNPFVPSNPMLKNERCSEIVQIISHGLIGRMQRAKIKKAVIGISGGLDSTLALLAVDHAFKLMNWDKNDIIAITMPGFGTTSRTKNNAKLLCEALGINLKEIQISDIALQEFEAIGHDKNTHDVTYENVQARIRTSALMNIANKEGGLVIGTGDMSEIALGWNTYNGDHMSMYGLNSGIPKTLIRYVIEYFQTNANITHILQDILDTPVSPELLPSHEDQITQETEKLIGPYELHDFFLYHMLKYGARPSKILFLATYAFNGKYDTQMIKKWLKVFLNRFFTQQFKRNAMPDGPKVGMISLSQRADWRMPSDADFQEWLKDLE
ncbi:MAG: NAD(+) synthase [Sulfurovaceae bacterium]|nr:NAD(+) synthase [Sulfurovaceae bacterium]